MNSLLQDELSVGPAGIAGPSSDGVGSSLFFNSTAARLADQYADLLALGWRRREAQLTDPTLDFADLAASDDRIQAALESLLMLGRHAAEHMAALSNDLVRRGEMFALALYALATANAAMLDNCEALAAAVPDLQVSLLGAFEWAPASSFVQTRIEALPIPARLHLVGFRYREFDGMAGHALSQLQLTLDPAAADICSALQMVCRFGRDDLALAALRYLDHTVATVRLVAAQTVLALAPAGHESAACDVLIDLANATDCEIRDAALQCAVLLAPESVTQQLELIKQSGATRLYLLALGWLGRTDAIPALLEYLDDPQFSRVAAASLALITGSDPARDGWLGSTLLLPSADDTGDGQMPDIDQDDALPWPQLAAFAEWWHAHGPRYHSAQRYFAGGPVTADWLSHVLTSGPLAWRPLAAQHLQRVTHGPLFPTSLPAPAQRALFHTLIQRVAP